MKSFIRSLSPTAEFGLILFIGFGLALAENVWLIITRFARLASPDVRLGNRSLLLLLGCELAAMPIIWLIGSVRGWSLNTLGLRISWKLTGAGILVAIIASWMIAWVAAWLQYVHPTGWRVPGSSALAISGVLLVVIVNSFFEEVIGVGYVVHALERFGVIVVFASASLRGFLHAYGGFNAVVLNFMIGLLFGFIFWAWRELWPLVVAHAILDLVALLPLVHASRLK